MTNASTTEEDFGPYRVVRRLTGGGMADIFVARKEGPGGFSKTFVVKRIRARFAEEQEFVRMFYDEARLAAKLEHPNIVHISDFGETNGSTFLAMEYLQGHDLNALLRQHGPLPVDVAAAIASQACAGLHYAHTFTDETGRPLRVVHRDISPSNLFLTKQGAVKVLDFGIARAEGRLNQTRSGMMKGKLLYMSPEQTWGAAVDARSDIWALGVVLYELLTRVRPFFRGSVDEPESVNERRTMEAIDSATPDRLSAMREEIPHELDDLVFRCLEKKPEARWQSALELRRILDAFLQSRGVSNSVLADFAEALERAPHTAVIDPTLVASVSDPEIGVETQLRVPEIDATKIAEPVDFVPRASRTPKVVLAMLACALVGGFGWAWSRHTTTPPPLRVSSPQEKSLRPQPPPLVVDVPPVVAVTTIEQPPPTVADVSPVIEPIPIETPVLAPMPKTPKKKPVRAEQAAVVVPPVPAVGTLRITCEPWGNVTIDGEERGQANPSMTLELSVGVHKVGCVHPDLGKPRGDVTIAAGSVIEKRFKY